VSVAKTVESIEMPFVMWTWVGTRNHVLVGVQPQGRGNFEEEVASVCGCDAAFCQITLTACYHHHHHHHHDQQIIVNRGFVVQLTYQRLQRGAAEPAANWRPIVSELADVERLVSQ